MASQMTVTSPECLQGVRALANAIHREPVAMATGTETDICTWAVGEEGYRHVEVPDLLIGVLTAGDVRWDANNRTGKGCFRRGRLAVIPAITALNMEPVSPLIATTVHISPAYTNRVFGIDNGGALLADAELKLGFANPLISSSLVALADEIRRPSQKGSVFADSVITMLLHQALYSTRPKPLTASRGGMAPVMLRRVKDFIEDELANPVRLERLAGLAGLSQFYFCRAFKAETGMTPHQYLTDARMRRATEMLRDPASRITDIALAVGFSSHAHFSFAFRRAMGVSPTAYRRSLQ